MPPHNVIRKDLVVIRGSPALWHLRQVITFTTDAHVRLLLPSV